MLPFGELDADDDGSDGSGKSRPGVPLHRSVGWYRTARPIACRVMVRRCSRPPSASTSYRSTMQGGRRSSLSDRWCGLSLQRISQASAVPVLAPTDGTVMTVHDSEFDHPAYRGLPSLGYALTQRRRAEAGWRALAGNHVMIKSSGGIVALCHLQRGSARVRPGQDVHVGQEIGRCGNSGNSTEPHLHVQALDGSDIERAAARRISFRGSLPSNGSIIAV